MGEISRLLGKKQILCNFKGKQQDCSSRRRKMSETSDNFGLPKNQKSRDCFFSDYVCTCCLKSS